VDAFSPPGNVDDLTAAGRKRWSQHLDRLIEGHKIGNTKVPNDSPRPQFFNPLRTPIGADADEAVLQWIAFPAKFANGPTPDRWKLAEDRDEQDEYCEWSADRDANGNVTAAYFTTEVPEYYFLLADDGQDHDRLLSAYRASAGPGVAVTDLITASGDYIDRNHWNKARAIHLVQQFNTLGAAVQLVAQSSIVREGPDGLLSNASDLIACGVVGGPGRNSDPLIIKEVNELARLKASVSLADPIGLYLGGLNTAGWKTPDGADPQSFWKVTRGDAEHAVRAVYAVPASRNYTVSDIAIDGVRIGSPSQIAERVSVKVVAVAHRFGKSTVPARQCDAVPSGPGLAGATPRSVEELIAAAQNSR
jgi:hypothetical protein